MSKLKDLFHKELEDLKTLRDELKVKAHLAKADISDELEKLDQKWPAVEKQVEKVAKEVETGLNQAGKEIEKAATEAFGELKKAYQDLAARSKEPPAP
ncbi:MAG: hypothetical protein U1E65_16520 [Myxococcota bacterium]